MQEFIARQNIERFTKLLEDEPDAAQRRRLEQMIDEERAKLHSLASSPDAPPGTPNASAPDRPEPTGPLRP